MARSRVALVLLVFVASCGRPVDDLSDAPIDSIGSSATSEWRTRLVINNPNPAPEDKLGFAVAVNERFIAAAANEDDEGVFNSAGAVYVFDTTDGSLLARIPSPVPEASAQFGTSVCLDGDRLVITSQYADDVVGGVDTGRAWLFDAPTGVLISDLGAGDAPNDFYGWSCAINEEFIAIGARNDTPSGVSGSGSVTLFRRDGSPAGFFQSPNPVIQGAYGRAISLAGTRLIVGAPEEDLGTDFEAGRVYVYHAESGQELFQIQSPGPLPMADRFGSVLAVHGSVAAISGDGLFHVYDIDTRNVIRIIDPLGASLDIDGSTMISGAGGGPGLVAQLHNLTTGAFLHQVNGTGILSGEFNNNVDVAGDIAVAGAPGDDVGPAMRAGRVHVLQLNTSPTADPRTLAATEDTGIVVNLSGSDAQNDPLTFVVVNQPVSGVLSGSPPSLTYTPNANFHGTDFFTFKTSEQPSGTLESDPATVLIDVASVDDVPTATNDALTIPEDSTGTVAVLTNDGGFGDGAIAVSVLSAPSNGEALALSGNTIRYAPNPNYAGADSFTYRITDADGDIASATVNVTVQPTNDAPIATDDAYATNEDQVLVVAAGAGVLANDVDVDGPSATAAVVVPPASGSLSLAANGSFTYTPNANFSGNDVFTYACADGTLTSAPATVLLHVTAVDDVPAAQSDTANVNEDAFVNVAVLSNDANLGDGAITVTIATAPANGEAIALSGGLVRYTPDADYAGADSVGYTITDADGDVSAATIALTVNAVTDAPVAADDAFGLDEDETLVIPAGTGVLANDFDADGSALTVQLVTPPGNGTLSLAADGGFTFDPDANFAGGDFFSYLVSDGTTSAMATAVLSVAGVADAPTAAVLLSPIEGDGVTKDFLFSWAPSIDADGDPVEYSIEVLEDGVLVASATSLVTTLELDDSLGKGDYTWSIEASDPDGNSTTSDAASFSVKGSGGGGGCSVTPREAGTPTWLPLAGFLLLLRRRAR